MNLAEHVKILSDFLPGGRLFNKKNRSDSNLYKLLTGLASEYLNVGNLIDAFLFNIIPDKTELFIDELERAFGIPDDCFPGTGTLQERRSHLLAKIASLGVTTAQDFVDLADLLGVSVTVSNGIDELITDTFPMTFPFTLDYSPIIGDTFPMTFPFTLSSGTIIESYFFEIVVTYTGPQPLIQCLFEKLKPAHCTMTFIEL